jgi:hypothetical protein
MSGAPFSEVKAAVAAIESFSGRPEEFVLPIDDSLQDPIGIYMAIIGDKILARRWEPNGFEQKEGYRVYRYKEMS